MKLFSLDHLLLAGIIFDRGQLSQSKKRELNRRLEEGQLITGHKLVGDKMLRFWKIK